MEEKACIDYPTPSVVENYYDVYTVEIKKANNGFVVNVGCQAFVFENKERMYKYIDMYLTNPSETESTFRKGELFND